MSDTNPDQQNEPKPSETVLKEENLVREEYIKLKEVSGDDDDEIEDPYDTLKKKCAKQKECKQFARELDTCTLRVMEHGEKTGETCVQEVFDLIHCVDHCAAHKLFSKLK